jgi:hypothetical protein
VGNDELNSGVGGAENFDSDRSRFRSVKSGVAEHIKSQDAVSGQSKMDRSDNLHPRYVEYVPLYCSQPTQTQPESDYELEAESSDFPPIRVGKPERMSPTSAMRRNQQQPSLLSNEEEPPQLCHRQQRNTGLGKTNILNVVDATAPMQHRLEKVTLYILCR